MHLDTLNWEFLGSPKILSGLILQLLDLLQSSVMSFSFLLLLMYWWVPGTVFLGKETVYLHRELCSSTLGHSLKFQEQALQRKMQHKFHQTKSFTEWILVYKDEVKHGLQMYHSKYRSMHVCKYGDTCSWLVVELLKHTFTRCHWNCTVNLPNNKKKKKTFHNMAWVIICKYHN